MDSRLIKIYYAMKTRCYNPNHDHYKDYGGRGIKICDEWLNSPWKFYQWALHNGYAKGLSIDRIDHEKGYFPENCRWATQKEQCNNTRKNILLEYKGQTKTLAQWCDVLNLKYSRIYHRLFVGGWTTEQAFEIKDDPLHKKILYKGEEKSLSEWCKLLGLSEPMIRRRITIMNWSVERAFETEKRGKKK